MVAVGHDAVEFVGGCEALKNTAFLVNSMTGGSEVTALPLLRDPGYWLIQASGSESIRLEGSRRWIK